MTIQDEIKDMIFSIKDKRNSLKLFRAEVKKLRKLNLNVVSSLNVYESAVYFYLDTNASREDQRDFVHAAAKIYNVELTKSEGFEATLKCSGKLEDGRKIFIHGYVPPTCHIEEVAEEAADWEIEAAKKRIERDQALIAAGKKIVSKVVCC
jgi:hypothetical protein